MEKSFKKEFKGTLKEKFRLRKKLIKPFLKKYKEPVIVHATHNEKTFEKILKEGKIKLPKEHNTRKKCPYMEKLLKIDDSIYYSLGFIYSTSYNFKFNFLFRIGYLKYLKYYTGSVVYNCYKRVIDYWYNFDKEYLKKFENYNKITREVMNKYYYKEYNNKARCLFDFWKVEKILFNFIKRYQNKKKIEEIINKAKKEKFIKFPNSLKSAKKDCLIERAPEIIGNTNNDLLYNRFFLGFYIYKKIPKKIMKTLKEKYPNKLLYDGKKIKRITYPNQQKMIILRKREN
jgi:hypothetical protein